MDDVRAAQGSLAWLFAYAVMAFRCAYGGTTARALLRTAAVGVVYFMAIGNSVAAMVAPIFTRAFR